METRQATDRRTGKRSVLGSILGVMLAAALVAMALELVAASLAGPHSSGQALARGADGIVTLERQAARGGTLVAYPIQY
jgi:hypothetical protein